MSLQSKNIPLSGLSTSPSDYSSPDGHLSAAIGVVHEDGAVKNVVHTAPEVLLDLSKFKAILNGIGYTISDSSVIYTHEGNDFIHYICFGRYEKEGIKNDFYFYIDVTNESPINYNIDIANEEVCLVALNNIKNANITSIGNSLVFSSEGTNYYYLWKNNGDMKQYEFLGNKLPEISISFGLQRHFNVEREPWTDDDGNTHYGTAKAYRYAESEYEAQEAIERKDLAYMITVKSQKDSIGITHGKYITPQYIKPISDSVHGYVRRFIHNEHEKGRFVHQFLVRYAYRLYDNSIFMHSCPVLMVTNSECSILPVIDEVNRDDDGWKELKYHLECQSYDLDYALSKGSISELKKWNEIIKSVDIFVSAPIYPYYADKEITEILLQKELDKKEHLDTYDIDTYFWYASQSADDFKYQLCEDYKYQYDISSGELAYTKNVDSKYRKRSLIYSIYQGGNITHGRGINMIGTYSRSLAGFEYKNDIYLYPPIVAFKMPMRSKKDICEEIENCSEFYFITSLNFDDLKTERTIIEIGDGVLNNIVTRERMKDDYYSHDNITGKGIVGYNHRLNIFNASRSITYAPSLEDIVCFQNESEISTILNTKYTFYENSKRITIGSGYKYVKSELFIPYICYPNPNLKSIQFAVQLSTENKTPTILLKEHLGLNASVWFNKDGLLIQNFEKKDIINTTPDNFVLEPSNVYTSEVDNPFKFMAENVQGIGNGTILSLVPSTIALSEGQFGQFPMYAFTTDGIWALSVNETGGWSSVQPVSRDVPILNNEGKPNILQLDRDIIFATDRGLMMLSGSNISCISEVFDGNYDQWFAKYSTHLDKLLSQPLTDIKYSAHLFIPFREYLTGGNMHYDYTHQRIIISHPDYPFCFVFSMKDRLWSAMQLNVTSAINSYPEAYAMATEANEDGTSHNVMINFTSHAEDADRNIYMPSDGYILTRPIKLGAPDMLKTIRSINLRGVFSRDNFGMVLYGTNDPSLQSWVVVGSVKGARMQFRYGSPYKAFRVAILSHMEADESLSHMEIVYEVKETDKVR